ncbi:MAG: peptide ABC transporter substrate-binding protein [Candidatus Saccharimonadales bacterium]
MIPLNRATKLRLRRNLRQRQKQVENATLVAEVQFEKRFIGRLEKLRAVRRFVGAWVALLVVLIFLVATQTIGLSQYYLERGPIAGGVFNEGMVGTYSNANPIYAVGAVDTSVSRLLFSGLFKYDDSNRLVGDLAENYTVDESGKLYTVHLKPGLTWHDGRALTAKDVIFTFQTIQNADAKSPLRSSWEGVKLEALGNKTITFQLPNALTAFPYSLTTGILPAHILSTVPPAKLRAAEFNTTKPVGAGPFAWSALQLGTANTSSDTATALISLKAFNGYNGGRPKLQGLVLHTYEQADAGIAAYRKHTVEAVAGLRSVPTSLVNDRSTTVYRFNTTAAQMIFFKLSEGVLKDTTVRKALVLGADRNSLLRQLGYPVRPVDGPLLRGQLGYDKLLGQAGYDPEQANKLLTDAGWAKNQAGQRAKNGVELRFQVVAEDTEDNRITLRVLQKNWQALGVTMQPIWQQTAADLQGTIESHGYGALLYGIGIGVDPDVYVYWDSSQAGVRSSSRLNFSEYKSAVADAALESGRTRSDAAARVTKYAAFLKAWQEDTPALGLYQPVDIYISRGTVHGLNEHTINTDADRYYSVASWAVKSGQVPKR